MSGGPVIIYADPYTPGHHTEHLGFYLLVCARLGIRLVAHVPDAVWEGAVRLAGAAARDAEHVAAEIPLAEETFGRKMRFLDEVGRSARARAAALVFFPTLDSFLFEMAFRYGTAQSFGVPWSGVFFADCFNYLFEQIDWPKRFVKSLMKLAAIKLAVRGGAVELFTLNKAWHTDLAVPVTWLPDSFSSLDQMASDQSRDGLWPISRSESEYGDRVRFLMFGALQPRKGLTTVAEAFLALGDEELKRVELRALGRFDPDGAYKRRTEALFAELSRRGALVELRDAYVDPNTLDRAIRRCDVVLAPYQGHIGSSGVMNIAAQYGRPLITQRRYQLGDEVRRFGLGITTDTSRPGEIAHALRAALDGRLTVTEGMRAFRRERTPAKSLAVMCTALSRLAPVRSEERLDGLE